MIADAPDGDVEVPGIVAALAGSAGIRPVWHNELGGLTFQLGEGPRRRFVKWQPAAPGSNRAPEPAPAHAPPPDHAPTWPPDHAPTWPPDSAQTPPPDLTAEVARLRWAAPFTPVPEVLDHGADDRGSWLLTAGLPGDSAVDPRWRADPGPAVTAIGAGLRAWHDRLPVAGCPFRWTPEDGRPAPPVPGKDLVVCHGDACAPNTLLDERGRWTGHVDVGALGVGDRWADLAIATWSTRWNYGPGWEEPLLAAYGIAPDPHRTRLYRDLWGSEPSP